jgi:hypothetical protein
MQDIDVFTFINKIGGASFATLLVVILWGSWRDIWCWGKDKRAAETSLLERDQTDGRGPRLVARNRAESYRHRGSSGSSTARHGRRRR